MSERERSDKFVATVEALKQISDLAECVYAEAVGDRYLALWSEKRGLRESNAPACAARLFGAPRAHRSQPGDCCPPGVDHPSLWLNKDGKPAVFVFQPYSLADSELKALAGWCGRNELKATISTWPAWHFPGAVLMVEIEPTERTRPKPGRSGFHKWLMRQVRRNDPVGAIARDARQDYEWPRESTALKAYQDHLLAMGAIPGAHAALTRAWREWEATVNIPVERGILDS